jgi:hypothetical protein
MQRQPLFRLNLIPQGLKLTLSHSAHLIEQGLRGIGSRSQVINTKPKMA